MEKKHIRDIVFFHDFTRESGQILLIIEQIILMLEEASKLSRIDVGKSFPVSMILGAERLDSPEKIKGALAGYHANHKGADDLLLLEIRSADPEVSTMIVRVRSGYTIIGPNDGSLSYLAPEDILELRIITERRYEDEFSRRLGAVTSIIRNRLWDEFSIPVDTSELKR